MYHFICSPFMKFPMDLLIGCFFHEEIALKRKRRE
jgi:hypothetical protein